jgi:hypothetical protein
MMHVAYIKKKKKRKKKKPTVVNDVQGGGVVDGVFDVLSFLNCILFSEH